MRVNTDGVLLAAWTNLPPFQKSIKTLNILDIGTGTGVITLILAQRLSQIISDIDFKIVGIDIDHPSIEDARYNFDSSPWKDSLTCEVISLQEYLLKTTINNQTRVGSNDMEKYSLIVSNPPYFTNSLKAPSQRRSAARHNDTLPLSMLIDAASKLLRYNGILSLILPVEEGRDIIELTNNHPLYLSRLCRIKTTTAKPVKRYMMEFKRGDGDGLDSKIEELIIQNTDGTYTEHYCNLISDYYSKDLRAPKIEL